MASSHDASRVSDISSILDRWLFEPVFDRLAWKLELLGRFTSLLEAPDTPEAMTDNALVNSSRWRGNGINEEV